MKNRFAVRLKKDIKLNWTLYLLVLPLLIAVFFISYKPMYGALIAFQDYRPAKGFGAEWVGLKHFKRFFSSPFAWRVIRNTLVINILQLLFYFPCPIILALLLNEVRNEKFKNLSQIFMHLPHFVSMVVVCGLVLEFCKTDGLINDLIVWLGGERENLFQREEYYRTIYIVSDIWKGVGWGSLIYLATLSGIDTQLYDAAKVDGAGRWQQTLHVTIPGMMPTVIVYLILNIGSLMSLGYEKTMLLYNSSIYETADVISTYVYRYGMGRNEWSYSTAIGLFNSVVNVVLVIFANRLSKKVTKMSLW